MASWAADFVSFEDLFGEKLPVHVLCIFFSAERLRADGSGQVFPLGPIEFDCFYYIIVKSHKICFYFFGARTRNLEQFVKDERECVGVRAKWI